MTKRAELYMWLAKTNLFISAFTFGGGYVVVPMVKKYFVQEKELFTEDELMEMAAIAQSTPGAIAVNLIAIVGYRVAGVGGVIISCICSIVPPIIILSIISTFYSMFIANTMVVAVLKGMQADVAALIVDFIVDMSNMILKERSPILGLLMVLSFAISFFTNVNVIFILLGSSAVCILQILAKRKREC